MIFTTKQAALLSLLEFTASMRAKHRVVRATVDGRFVGWTRVMKGVAK